jgi:(R,R)-butanediol dehydrogenase/meso-butanediol dehydrogenase/diacetyl reductase
MRVKASQLCATPDEITDQEAALNEPLAVALHAVRLSGLTVGGTVAITGAGPVGLMAIHCARLAGAKSIYVAQRSEPRAGMARQIGADMVINPDEQDFRRIVRKETGIGADVALECAGSSEAFQMAIRSIRPSGRLVLVGISGPTEISPAELMRRETEIKGSLGFWNEYADALQLQKLRMVETKEMVTKVVPLNDIQEAFDELLQAKGHIKILVAP